MKITIDQLRKIISEEIGDTVTLDNLDDIEPAEDAWSGGDNLVLDIDKAKAGGSEEATSGIEVLSIVDDRGVIRISESRLRSIVRKAFFLPK